MPIARPTLLLGLTLFAAPAAAETVPFGPD
jgi:hypothetical protein